MTTMLFCLHLLQGNSFRKFDPFHVVSWFAATSIVFLPLPLIDFLILRPYWFDEGFAGLSFHTQQLHGFLASRHFSCHCWSHCASETTLYYLNNSTSHNIFSIPWVISSLWYQLSNHYSNIQPTLWCLSLLNSCQVFWHWCFHCAGRLCGKYFFMRNWRQKRICFR